MTGILLTKSTTPVIGWIASLLGLIMDIIFNVLDLIGIPNIGISIILFTIIVYLLMLPLTIKQQKFSKLSAKMNPEMQAIREKYKNRKDNDSQMQMNAEMQAVYAKYGVSPTGSCVQLLIQMPILFALYQVIYRMPAYVKKIGNAFTALADAIMNGGLLTDFKDTVQNASTYIKDVDNISTNQFIDVLNRVNFSDVSAFAENHNITAGLADISKYNSFLVEGFNLANSPSSVVSTFFNKSAVGNVTIMMVILAIAIPVLSAVTQWINVLLMPKQESNTKKGEAEDTMASSMKTMNMVMPLMSAFFCYTLPAGLGLYWISGSVVRSIQQVVINKYMDKIDLNDLIEKNKEKSAKKIEKMKENQAKLQQYANMNTKGIGGTTNTKNYTQKAKEAASISENKASVSSKPSSGSAKPGSLMAKANMVKEYNERNNK
ncbi:MAG: YidC/Oxa1 family membrane protein insertase [Lachnospiraceae bacterium]|nr:YidC/Oxa1 family membrane protein insertase [Lachnospiraceae bacterium]